MKKFIYILPLLMSFVFIQPWNHGIFLYALKENSLQSEVFTPEIMPFVPGETVAASFFFKVKKQVNTHEWMEFRFSWNDVFPFIKEKPAPEKIFEKKAFCYFNPSVYCPSCLSILFNNANVIKISVPQVFLVGTEYSISFWREFGLTLPKAPGIYHVEWRSQQEKDWQIIAKFELPDSSQSQEELFQIKLSEKNYRLSSDIFISVSPNMLAQCKNLPTVTLVYPPFFKALAIEDQGLKPPVLDLPENSVFLNDMPLKANLNVNKSIKIYWPDNLDTSQKYTLTIKRFNKLLNPIPGEGYFWLSFGNHWFRSESVMFTSDKIPLRVYIDPKSFGFGFVFEYYHPDKEEDSFFQKFSIAIPEECYSEVPINWQEPNQLPRFENIVLHHIEKYLRHYMIFIPEKPRIQKSGEIESYSFIGQNYISIPKELDHIRISFCFNDGCILTTEEGYVYFVSNL